MKVLLKSYFLTNLFIHFSSETVKVGKCSYLKTMQSSGMFDFYINADLSENDVKVGVLNWILETAGEDICLPLKIR